jgi:hypothetical protein
VQLSSLSSSSDSTPKGRYKKRRTEVGMIGRPPSSLRIPIESRDIPAIEPSTEVVSYVYKPVADLLGLIGDSNACALGGRVDVSSAPDFLPDSRDAAAVVDAASRAGSGSVRAANAAYESSMHLVDEVT